MISERSSPLALMLLLLLLAACGSRGDSAAGQGDNGDEEEAPPVPVETSLPVRGDINAIYTGTAPIEAFAEADVLAKVAGEVVEILVEEGDEVSEGQVLARLDGDRLRLELKETEARLRKLERDYQRNIDLNEKGLISEGDFDRIKFDMEALRAAYNLAKLEVDYTQIRAPIDGVVSERYIKLGNTLAVGDPVFRVTQLDPLVAYLFVPEREFRKIGSGQPAGIAVDALSGPPVVAEVTRVSPIVDPETGTFKVTIEIDDPARRIKPGMFARIGIVYDTHLDALQIPRSAIVGDEEESAVFVVENSRAVRREVETGFADRGMIEITAGLDDTDEVIVVGQVGLRADAEVDVIGEADEQSPSGDEQTSVAEAAAGNGE